ncbi:MAG: hypothetical protein C0404_09105 [Verrucomicrobia bacterium]|nr:hypothetical protein [Verrucomicrobiota bacterium]
MRKDYIAIPDSDSSNEKDFVADYWTNVWNQSSLGKDVQERVEDRIEFRMMKPVLERLPRDARVLDGGCGPGAWTLALSAKGLSVTGMDLSEKTIGRLNELFPKEQFVAGDLRTTNFRDGEFSVYFAWGVFEHFEAGLGPCLREARRIIKKDGYLFASVPFHNRRLWRRDHLPLESVDAEYTPLKGYSKAMRFYQWRFNEQEFRRELELHGFDVQSVVPIHKEVGIHRMLVTDYGVSAGSRFHNILQKVLCPLLPAGYIANMVIAVGRKR